MSDHDMPEGYRACLGKMCGCAQSWLREHGTLGLHFYLPPPYINLCAALNHAIPMLARTTEARAFLAALDAASDFEATALQACVVVRALHLPESEWTERECAELLRRGTVSS